VVVNEGDGGGLARIEVNVGALVPNGSVGERPEESPRVPGPVLSVVLPVYDSAATVETTLRALRASRFRDFELIVVDDGSRDESAAIVERWKPDQLARNERNQGHLAAPS